MTANTAAMFDLTGSIAIVTGASSGIGAALAKGLAAAGARVALAARRLDRLQALANDIDPGGVKAAPFALDILAKESLPGFFDAVATWAGAPADILINNAGIAEPARFLKSPADSIERILATNFTAPWRLTHEFARRLTAVPRGGAVLNIGSVLGLGAGVGYASYSAAKAALHQLTRSLALELVPNSIRVNALAPGWFETEMNREFFASSAGRAYRERLPPGRLGELPELLGPALLLLSSAGSYVNGVILPVDGGHSIALV